MKRFWVILITIFGFFSFGLQAQNARREVRLGNKEYLNGEYQEAELFYRKALEDPQNFKDEALFNLGNALYRQDNFDAAGGSWAMAADLAVEKNQKSQAFYNLGNSLMSKQEFEKAIQAYKESLRKNPANEDARYNLEYAKKMLKQQEQQNQEQQNQEQQNQEQQNQEQQNQEQQNQEQQNQEQQNQEQQNQEQQNQEQQNQEQQNQEQQISREDAERMLEALKQNEKETMEKLNEKKVKATRVKIEKDW